MGENFLLDKYMNITLKCTHTHSIFHPAHLFQPTFLSAHDDSKAFRKNDIFKSLDLQRHAEPRLSQSRNAKLKMPGAIRLTSSVMPHMEAGVAGPVVRAHQHPHPPHDSPAAVFGCLLSLAFIS